MGNVVRGEKSLWPTQRLFYALPPDFALQSPYVTQQLVWLDVLFSMSVNWSACQLTAND